MRGRWGPHPSVRRSPGLVPIRPVGAGPGGRSGSRVAHGPGRAAGSPPAVPCNLRARDGGRTRPRLRRPVPGGVPVPVALASAAPAATGARRQRRFGLHGAARAADLPTGMPRIRPRARLRRAVCTGLRPPHTPGPAGLRRSGRPPVARHAGMGRLGGPPDALGPGVQTTLGVPVPDLGGRDAARRILAGHRAGLVDDVVGGTGRKGPRSGGVPVCASDPLPVARIVPADGADLPVVRLRGRRVARSPRPSRSVNASACCRASWRSKNSPVRPCAGWRRSWRPCRSCGASGCKTAAHGCRCCSWIACWAAWAAMPRVPVPAHNDAGRNSCRVQQPP